jgi:ADP-ribosylglycohydrolase
VLGAIVGDIIGSVHEFSGTKTKDFPLFVPESKFTDDSVLTGAVADWILSGRNLGGHHGRGGGGVLRWSTGQASGAWLGVVGGEP